MGLPASRGPVLARVVPRADPKDWSGGAELTLEPWVAQAPPESLERDRDDLLGCHGSLGRRLGAKPSPEIDEMHEYAAEGLSSRFTPPTGESRSRSPMSNID